ncbi:DUF863 family protein [Quillaja saponaria]|uniref:DUF863 family protein n=1 Tax=Quillaja saponaria TaxID=32244 RepID=A0AAD7LAR4_QUISA|nr:DUF863 family protein [Quillaja saponaria]KAJ7953875.1 DUF863 family protein [Quillaja saponaria]
MGTKVQSKSYLPGYYSMRDLNEDSSSCGWPLLYGDKNLTNGQYYNGYFPRATSDDCLEYDKDVVKQKMLEHEAIFKNQVYELHRLYRIQRDLMDEIKRKQLHRNPIPAGSFSRSPLASQFTSEDGQKWHNHNFALENCVFARPSTSVFEGNSPLASNKGNSKQACLFPSRNGSDSNDVQVLESRPTKVRRRMFDLQLPADEYIDTEESEKFSDGKISGTSAYLPDRNCRIGSESSAKLFLGDCGKAASQEETSRSKQFLGNTNGLADLNEPVQVEDTNASAYIDLNPCQVGNACSDVSAKQNSHLFGLTKEVLRNSDHRNENGQRDNQCAEGNCSGRGWISHVLEAGQGKSNLKSVSQDFPSEKLLLSQQTMQNGISKFHEPPSVHSTNRSDADFWRQKTIYDSEINKISHEISSDKYPESVVSSHRSSFFHVAPSSDLAQSWSSSISSFQMPSSSLTQKLMSVQMRPCLNTSTALSKSFQSGQSNGIFGDSWPLNSTSKSISGFGSEAPIQNGFYHGSSSGSKEFPVNLSSVSYNYLNYNNDRKGVPEHFNHDELKYHQGSNGNDMKSVKDVNLNVVLPNGSFNKLAPQIGPRNIDREEKNEDHLAVLPWLRAKVTCKSDTPNAGRVSSTEEPSFLQASPKSNIDETGKGANGFFGNNVSVSCSNDLEERRTKIGVSLSNRRILDFPVFEKPHISKNESSSLTPPSISHPNPSEAQVVENHRRNRILDINLPCDPAIPELGNQSVGEVIVNEKKSNAEDANFRRQIDLNLCMSDDEVSLTQSPSTNVKMKEEIDLEAPALPENEEDVIREELLQTPLVLLQGPQNKAEQPQDELLINAAEAIVSISSSMFYNRCDDTISNPSETSIVNPLSWFVDIISSYTDNLEDKVDSVSRGKDSEYNEDSSSEGIDYFEAMTLKLTATKEEDYTPEPLVPESFKVDETGPTLLPNRTRKGPARRGRQRRDFQRDILPGLVSLSRHEVTEDLQTFGGLMRAMGHSWSSGLTRRSSTRNGCGRGRRRLVVSPPPPVATNASCTLLVQQLNNIEVGLEDRSLTGWGKTTRRPRRQRCPAGNPPSLALT